MGRSPPQGWSESSDATGCEYITHLVILRHCLPVVHEENFQRVRHNQPHLRPSRPIVIIPPPFCAAPALFTSPASCLCAACVGGRFRGGGAGRSGSGLCSGKVLLKGEVGFAELEEACRRDPLVPARSKKLSSGSQNLAVRERGLGRTSASSLYSAQGSAAQLSLVLCSFRPIPRI
jgi:hypothetical protein